MKNFQSPVRVPAPTARPLANKAIFWGSEEGGTKRFPGTIQEIVTRRHSTDPVPLEEFGKAISAALDRVWVIDEYFFMPGNHKHMSTSRMIDARIVRILDWLSLSLRASDIRVLTKRHADVSSDVLGLLSERQNEINAARTRGSTQCAIQVRNHLRREADYIHDRFAIVDDELWHFGGTAGGLHPSVSASSRGWSAIDHGAVSFFEMAWDSGANL